MVHQVRFFLFPSIFTNLNSNCTPVPRELYLFEAQTGGDRQIQIGSQAGTNLKGRILVGDNPIALLKIKKLSWDTAICG